MNNFNAFLDYTLFTLYGHDYTVGQLLFVSVALLVGHYLIGKVRKQISQRLLLLEHSRDSVHLLDRILVIAGYVLLLLLVLSLLNIPLTAFAFVSGAVAIGVGFGAQNIFNNFISGWILMWEKPIRIGDFLEIDDVRGTVETINTRSTLIRRVDGVHMLVPNSQLLENTVVNWTLIDKNARGQVRVGVAYGSPVREVEALIYQATREHPDIKDAPGPLVIFEDFGDSALVFDVFFWIDAFGERDLRVIKSDIRYRIDELFAASDIVIAFPQRDVHLDGELRLVRAGQGEPAPQPATTPSGDA